MLRLFPGLQRGGCPQWEAVVDLYHEDVGAVIFEDPVPAKLAVLCLRQPASFLHSLAECTMQDILNTEGSTLLYVCPRMLRLH
eukprot:2053283-Rhodomonas_salina.1